MMEVEETPPPIIAANQPSCLAPIAEPEVLPPQEELGTNNMMVVQQQQQASSSSSSQQHSESVIAPPANRQKLGMVRLRRKRRLDPFGNLILSTKKMKLNDTANGEGSHPQQQGKVGQQQGSVECGDDDELVFYYGGEDDEDDSADGYDDDEDSNAEQYYKNDYPEEEGAGNGLENESTSDDDYFDHYGDENVKYRNYCCTADNKDISDDEDDYD